jgi:hypothetical protein
MKPMKLSGTDSCISMALMKTKSPTVWVPAITSIADMAMTMVMPMPKMTALAEIQPAERGPDAGRRRLVARHRAVEALAPP